VPKLTEEEFKATIPIPAVRIVDESPPFDFWPYVDGIPPSDFQGYDCSAGVVEWVYRDEQGVWEHVTINTDTPNVFMVVVLDLRTRCVHGHHLLDLNHHYGVDPLT